MSTDTLDSMLTAVAAAPSTRPPPRIGQQLGGRYRIEAFVGEGGMGMVFRALDEKLGETVALKVVRGAIDEQVLHDEVRLAQKVTHPNVCRTFDLEEVDGYHLVKMEMVPGETLAVRLLRESRLPVDECIRIARAIAAGLGAAHAKKIVHGDLKPSNVMLDGERVVLMDFGVARSSAAPVDGVRGTVGYIAPELVRDRAADERADIYALGCVLYEMLAGEPVFGTGSSITIAARHVAETAPDVRRKRQETPRWLTRAVAMMLAKRPEDRTAGLAQLLAGPRSHAGVVARAVLLALAGAVAAWRMTRPPPWVAAVHDYEKFDENGDPMSFSPDAEWIAFSSNRREREHNRAYVMSRRTGETVAIAPDRDANGVRWTRDGTALVFSDLSTHHFYRVPVRGSPPHADGPIEDLGAGDVLDDCGDAFLIQEPTLSSWRVLLRFGDGKRRQLFATDTGVFVTGASCAPDGKRVAIVAGSSFEGGHNDVYLTDRAGNVRRVTSDQRTADAVFAADGRSLVVSRLTDGRLQLFEMDLEGGNLRRLLVNDAPSRPSDVSRDGRFLAFRHDDNAAQPAIISAAGIQYVTRKRAMFWFPQELTENLIVAARNSPDGNDVVTLRADTGAVTVLARGAGAFPSLDGRTIYFRGADDRTLLAVSATGGQPVPVATLPGKIQFGSAGPDGLHVSVEAGNNDVRGYRISGTTVEDEGAKGLVSVAAPGGWRAVTSYAGKAVGDGAELYLVPPGASLDRADRHFHVGSMHNRWIDDHRIGYCLEDHCEVLNVTTGEVVKLPSGNSAGLMASVTLDGTHVLDTMFEGQISHHVITNFGDR